jgi:hypothetical protein
MMRKKGTSTRLQRTFFLFESIMTDRSEYRYAIGKNPSIRWAFLLNKYGLTSRLEGWNNRCSDKLNTLAMPRRRRKKLFQLCEIPYLRMNSCCIRIDENRDMNL